MANVIIKKVGWYQDGVFVQCRITGYTSIIQLNKPQPQHYASVTGHDSHWYKTYRSLKKAKKQCVLKMRKLLTEGLKDLEDLEAREDAKTNKNAIQK